MSDEEVFAEEEIAGGVGQELGDKTGFLPAVVIRLLKWVALGLGAIIFIVSIVVVTVNFLNKGPQNVVYPSPSEKYQETPPLLQWYDLGQIRARTSDDRPVTVIVNPKLGYEMNNAKVQSDLIQRREYLIDAVRTFFSLKKESDLTPDKDEMLKTELRERLNKLVDNQEIQDIVFIEFNVVEF